MQVFSITSLRIFTKPHVRKKNTVENLYRFHVIGNSPAITTMPPLGAAVNRDPAVSVAT